MMILVMMTTTMETTQATTLSLQEGAEKLGTKLGPLGDTFRRHYRRIFQPRTSCSMAPLLPQVLQEARLQPLLRTSVDSA
jgi:hypothetical protein